MTWKYFPQDIKQQIINQSKIELSGTFLKMMLSMHNP